MLKVKELNMILK